MKTPFKTEILGIPVTVVSDEVAEQATAVACAPWSFDSPFTDDVRTDCAICGAAIRHRPYVPKKPPKLCLPCAIPGYPRP